MADTASAMFNSGLKGLSRAWENLARTRIVVGVSAEDRVRALATAQSVEIRPITKQGGPAPVGEQHDAELFRFMDLAPELRNCIYEYSVISDNNLLLPGLCFHRDHPHAVEPSITRVSRQVRQESLSLFYKCNVFEAHVAGYDFDSIIEYLQIHAAAKFIGKIELHFIGNHFSSSTVYKCAESLRAFVYWWAGTRPHVEFDVQNRAPYHPNTSTSMSVMQFADQLRASKPSKQKVKLAFEQWLSDARLRCHCGWKFCWRSRKCSNRKPSVEALVCTRYEVYWSDDYDDDDYDDSDEDGEDDEDEEEDEDELEWVDDDADGDYIP